MKNCIWSKMPLPHFKEWNGFEKWRDLAKFGKKWRIYIKKSGSTEKCFSYQKLLNELLDWVFSSAPARFLPQKIAKHLLNRPKMSVEPTTETILWRQISDLSGQFSDHRSQNLSVQKFKSVGDMGHCHVNILLFKRYFFP
jgi:hypothetical protein